MDIEICLLLFSSALLTLGIILWIRLANGSFIPRDISSLFLYFFLCLSFLGYPLLNFVPISYTDYYGLHSEYFWRLSWFIAILSGISLMVGKVVCVVVVGNPKPPRINIEQSLSAFKKLLLLSAVVLSIFMLYLYLKNINAPFFALIFGGETSSGKLAELRSQSTNASGLSSLYKFGPEFFSPFLSYVFFSRLVLLKRSDSIIKFSLVIMFLVCVIYFNANLMKGKFLYYLVSLMFLYILLRKSENFSLPRKLILVFATFSLIPVFILMAISGSEFINAVWHIFERIVGAGPSVGYMYALTFDSESFLLGRSFPNPLSIFPYEPFPLAVYMSNSWNPNFSNTVVGSMPGPFYVELFANFGFAGVIIGSIVIGFAIFYISFCFRKSSNIYSICFGVCAAFYLCQITTGNLFPYVIPANLIILYLFTKMLNMQVKRNRL